MAVLALLLLWLPCVMRGADSYVTIDDNLDAEINIPYVLHQVGVVLDYRPGTTLPPIMDGLPRSAVRPGLSVTVGLFGLLSPLAAYWVNQLMVRAVALLGIFCLLRRYVWPEPENTVLAASTALAWAVLPTYTMYGLSALGTPWPLLAVLNLRAGRGRWFDWLVLLFFPLWSSLVLAGAFIVAGLGAFLLVNALRARQLAWSAWAGLLVLTLSYAVVEWPLLRSVFVQPEFVPHRVEFRLAELAPAGLLAGVRSTVQFFLWGQYHSSRFFHGVVLLVVAMAAWQFRSRTGSKTIGEGLRPVAVLLLVLLALAVFCGFYPQLMTPVQRVLPALGAFNLTRFHFLTPLLWFGVLVLALRLLPSAKLRLGFVGLQLALGLLSNLEWLYNARMWLNRPTAHEPTWRQYVAPALFTAIRQELEQRQQAPASAWRVACLGFPPAVAQLNGFYTLDSYQNNYPLQYKHRFRPIIAGELAKSPELRRYYDAWGNRCYVVAAELGKNFREGRNEQAVVNDFRFDAVTFRQMGGQYLLSAARLATPNQTGLQLIKQYSDPTAYWQVYLYEVIPQ
ncbi:DUF6044 family protein [Hymenobacter koreensis]|uniref:DUF6044 family protein n=2 Tax=Hymenobacter koreensis TaxID=1084523 RepID=A0ABP8J9R5_9BACT